MKLQHLVLASITVIFLGNNTHARYLEQMRRYGYVSTRPTAIQAIHTVSAPEAIVGGLPTNPASPDARSTARFKSSPQVVTQDQYADGMNLYQYCRSNPINFTDPFGLETCNCGPDITGGLRKLNLDIYNDWRSWGFWKRVWKCTSMYDPVAGWDIHPLGPGSTGPTDTCCPSGDSCRSTVTVSGNCYGKGEVNYWLWGRINKLCDKDKFEMLADIYVWKIGGYHHLPSEATTGWAKAGYDGRFSGVAASKNKTCKPCSKAWGGLLSYTWGY